MSANGIDNEKEFFTKERLISFKRWNTDIEKINLLENKWGNICLTPLDIPRIQATDHQRFVDWFYKTCKPSVKQNADVATTDVGYSKFKSIDLVPPGANVMQSVWSKNPVNNFSTLWPDLWEQMHEYLPFESINGFTIWNSTEDILPHRDPGAFTDFPVSFRILLDDTNTEPNLVVGECLPNADPFNVTLTKAFNNKLDTNSLVWNNLRTMHWSKKDSNQNKILLIMLPWVNKINLDKYDKLIDRSLQKYRTESLISSYKIDNWISL